MTLILHRGAEPIDYDMLRQLATPEPTATHVPIAHYRLVDLVVHSLTFFGHEVIDQQHGVTPDGALYFGVIKLKSAYGDYVDLLGLRNSHTKVFPAACAIGAAVVVCDNLSFHGQHVIKRKHTARLRMELPGLVMAIIEPLAEQRKAQALTFERYKAAYLDDATADHTIMEMYRRGVIGVQRIADVDEQYHNPSCDWGPKTAWRMFNSATFALAGKVAEAPGLTQRLHQVIDGVCETIH